MGARPALPTLAAMTVSASGWLATSSCETTRHAGGRLDARDSGGSSQETALGWNSRACSASRSRLCPAESPTTENSSGKARTMSSVCLPIEPVDPNMASLFTSPVLQRNDYKESIYHDNYEHNAIQPVQNSAVARDKPASVLRAG